MKLHHSPISLLELLPEGLSPADSNVARDLFVSELSMDSRAVSTGGVFVALQGGTQHGLDFALQAQDGGAAAILWDATAAEFTHPALKQLRVPCFRISNLRAGLGQMAARLYPLERPLRVIAVTGTNGKTSSVQLFAQALSFHGMACACIGTLGVQLGSQSLSGERTTPDVINVHRTLRYLSEQGALAVAMEVSSHALDQGRIDGVEVEIAIFTNLTRDHLDYHHSMEAYGAAKAKLFMRPELQVAILPRSEFGDQIAQQLSPNVRLLRTGDAAEIAARAVELNEQGVRFELCAPGLAQPVQTALLGRFNVDNLLGVIAALHAFGLTWRQIIESVAKLQPVQGRMNKIGGGLRPVVVVDYAHTPDALVQVLSSLREHTRGKLICVFGCGGERDPGKRPLMAAAVDQLADLAIVTNDNPRREDPGAITAQILAGFARLNAKLEQRRELAIAWAINQARAGDLVLIAGKGHENYQEIGSERLPFDDLAIAKHCLFSAEAA